MTITSKVEIFRLNHKKEDIDIYDSDTSQRKEIEELVCSITISLKITKVDD